MIKINKDLSRLVERTKITAKSTSDGKRHYWDVFLWPDAEAFNAATDCEGASACHLCSPVLIDPESGEPCPGPKMGEVHFMCGRWNMEIVAHELAHALFHRLRFLCPGRSFITDGCGYMQMESEEVVCYEFGDWVHLVYTFLWTFDTTIKKRVVTEPEG